jgi:outer membrane protein TolC
LEASRVALGETAWQIRSRVRGALIDNLLASGELEALRQEQQTRTEALKLYDERLAAGEISQPEVDVVRTSLTLIDVTMQRAIGLQNDTRIALETALGLAPRALDGVQLRRDTFESPPGGDRLQLTSVQRAGC